MPIKIFNEIGEMLIENIMRHEQFADMMDFLGCRGFKRIGEYHFFKESAELRGLHRYAINHCNKLVVEKNIPTPRIIPSSWEGVTRHQVDENTRKKYIRQLFMDWLDWEKEARVKYSAKYRELLDANYFHAAKKVEHLMEDNECEIKYLERMIIEYTAVDWNMLYLMQKQDALHECYKEKTKNIGIDIC